MNWNPESHIAAGINSTQPDVNVVFKKTCIAKYSFLLDAISTNMCRCFKQLSCSQSDCIRLAGTQNLSLSSVPNESKVSVNELTSLLYWLCTLDQVSVLQVDRIRSSRLLLAATRRGNPGNAQVSHLHLVKVALLRCSAMYFHLNRFISTHSMIQLCSV